MDNDLIRRGDVMKLIGFWGGAHGMNALSKVRQIPAVDAVEVVHGEWYWTGHPNLCQCLVCREWSRKDAARRLNFCPNCGARMDGEEEHNAAD